MEIIHTHPPHLALSDIGYYKTCFTVRSRDSHYQSYSEVFENPFVPNVKVNHGLWSFNSLPLLHLKRQWRKLEGGRRENG